MKKNLLVLLSLILAVSLYVPNNTYAKQLFSDVPESHNYYEDIMYLVDEGVISTASNYFGTGDIVTREEVAVMVAKAVGLNGAQRPTKFSDVPATHKNSGYIQSAVEAGIINGFPEGTFKPNQKVKRGHMAAFIARAFDLPSGSKTFKDVPKGHTAYIAVNQLAEAGITTGYPDNTFKPENNLTRAHISAFLARALKFQRLLEETYSNDSEENSTTNETVEPSTINETKEDLPEVGVVADPTAEIDNSATLTRATKEQLDYFINPNRPAENSEYGFTENYLGSINNLIYKKGNYLQLGGLSPVIMSSTIPDSSNDTAFNNAIMNELRKISSQNGGSGELVYNHDLSRLAYDRTLQWENAGKVVGNDVDAAKGHFADIYPSSHYLVPYYSDSRTGGSEVLVKLVDFRQFDATNEQMAEFIGGVIRSSVPHTNTISAGGHYGLGYRTDAYGAMYVSIIVSNR